MVLSDTNLVYADHIYVLDGVGVKDEKSFKKLYFTRENAEKEMYKLMKKYSVRSVKIQEDKHDKTYICDNGTTFYITRMA